MKLTLALLVLSLSTFAVMAHEPEKFAPLTEIELADGRNVLGTADGRVAYTFDADDVNVSNCYDACAKAWPPILVQSDQGLKQPMGTTVRKDGSLQLTLDSQPLYFFVNDKNPGDIKGDGLGGVWHIIVD